METKLNSALDQEFTFSSLTFQLFFRTWANFQQIKIQKYAAGESWWLLSRIKPKLETLLINIFGFTDFTISNVSLSGSGLGYRAIIQVILFCSSVKDFKLTLPENYLPSSSKWKVSPQSLRVSYVVMRPMDSIHCDLYVNNFLKLADKSMTSVMEGKAGALLVGPTE